MLNRFLYNIRYALQPRKPLLMARIFLQVTRAFFGKAPLRYVDFALDFTCNQHCGHCFAQGYDQQRTRGRDQITGDQYSRIAREAYDMGAVSFSIQGGEPLAMLEKTEWILQQIPVSRCLVSLKTNGTLLNHATALRLVEVGVDIVTVSLDSGLPEEHDEFRGQKNAFTRAVMGIHAARAAGLKVMVACTISRANAGTQGVLRLIELCREWKVMLLFLKAAPSGKWQGNGSVLLTAEDSRWIEEMVGRHPHCRTDFEANYLSYGCGALKEIIYVSQYGDVMACPFIQVSFGNALREPLSVIRQRGLRYPPFSSYSQTCLIAEDQKFLGAYLGSVRPGRALPLKADDFFRENLRLMDK